MIFLVQLSSWINCLMIIFKEIFLWLFLLKTFVSYSIPNQHWLLCFLLRKLQYNQKNKIENGMLNARLLFRERIYTFRELSVNFEVQRVFRRSHRRCSIKKGACNFIKKETLAEVFSCEFCEFCKNTFSDRTPPGAASRINVFTSANEILQIKSRCFYVLFLCIFLHFGQFCFFTGSI